MLIELAVGDAYGAGFEYADLELVRRRNDLSTFVKHPRHQILPGSYTDDTQMSIAIAEAMLSGDAWTPEMLAQKFVDVFKRDPREGYARGFFLFLQNTRDGSQFLREIQPTSDKSGAAMRAAPIGIYPNISLVIKRSALQAALTHNTPDGINASIACSLMTHYFLYNLGAKRDLGHFLERQVKGAWAAPWVGAVRSKGWMSVRAAITAIRESNSLSELLKACIDFSGDVDTVATIALAAGSCCGEMVHDLPEHLFDALENGPYGRDYLCSLDLKLKTLWEEYRPTSNETF